MESIPVGLCQCGCGQPTKVSTKTRSARGDVAGEAVPYRPGHSPPRLEQPPTGPRSPGWKRGRIEFGGYIAVYRPDHPRAKPSIGYVYEHILVIEAAMGKRLRPDAETHHVDQNTRNNANSNLVACHDHAYHMLLHSRQRALDACGDPNALRCIHCGQYDRQDDISVIVARRNGKEYKRAYHRTCAATRRREWKARNTS